jgi:hypothetical protein
MTPPPSALPSRIASGINTFVERYRRRAAPPHASLHLVGQDKAAGASDLVGPPTNPVRVERPDPSLALDRLEDETCHLVLG